MASSSYPKKSKSNRRLKYILFGFAAVIALAVIAVFSIHSIKDARRIAQCRRAIAAADRGDLENAEKLLLECFRKDPNNETVILKLAEVNEKTKRYRNAAAYYRALSALNPFVPAYTEGRLRTLDAGRLYSELVSDIQTMSAEKREPYTEYLIHAKLVQGDAKQARQLLDSLPESRKQSERMRFDAFILDSSNPASKLNPAQINAELAKFSRNADESVAFSALLVLFFRNIEAGNTAEAERLLKRAVEINPECALYLLGDFYFAGNRLAEASAAYSKAMQRNLPVSSSIHYAETLFAEKKSGELKSLAQAFRRGNKEFLRIGNYLDAMVDYLADDYRAAAAKLLATEQSFRSPTALTLMLDTGVKTDNVELTVMALREIRAQERFKARLPEITEGIMPMLARLYIARRITEAAPLAEMLHSPRKPDVLTTRILLLDKSRSGLISVGEISAALKNFPDDPVILSIAARRALQTKDFAEMLALTRRGQAAGDNDLDSRFREITALEGLGRLDEAERLFASLAAADPGNVLLFKRRLTFAVRRNRLALLAALRQEATASKKEAIRNLAVLPQAELLFRAGKTAEGVAQLTARPLTELLDADDIEDRGLLYFAALRLGKADAVKPAIAIYEKLKNVLPDPSMVQLNLSELYAVSGRDAEALSEAQAVWTRNHTLPPAMECYAMRLVEAGRYAEALPVLRDIRRGNDTPRTIEARKTALEKLIASSFAADQLDRCGQYCAELLDNNPDNPSALEFRKKIAAAKQSGNRQ